MDKLVGEAIQPELCYLFKCKGLKLNGKNFLPRFVQWKAPSLHLNNISLKQQPCKAH